MNQESESVGVFADRGIAVFLGTVEARIPRCNSERKYQTVIEELEDAQRRAKTQIATLEEQRLEAKAGSEAKRTRTASS